MTGQALQNAIKRLHHYIDKTHWDGEKLVGPDPVGKIHWRITRFARSYFPFLPNEDKYIYLQGQAYWIKSNIELYHLTGEERYLTYAGKNADYIVRNQPEDGAWRHPPIWGRKGFISTVEGVWASLGLAAAFREIGKQSFLDSAVRWYKFQINDLGFQHVQDGLAANYYAHSDNQVPNVSTMLIWLTAELADITGDTQFLEYTERLLNFIEYSQMPSGELPYELGTRPHFMCFQYNSFQFLDLANYFEITQDNKVKPILSKLAKFLSSGLTANDSCRYNCHSDYPEVNYWTAALATALQKATKLQLGDYTSISERAFQYVLNKQREDGGFGFSVRNYKYFTDKRSYPRYLSMILMHLITRLKTEERRFVHHRQIQTDNRHGVI